MSKSILLIGGFIIMAFGTVFAINYWKPSRNDRFDIIFSNPNIKTPEAKIYDLDLFDTDTNTINLIHKKGGKVFCYINFGSWEDRRPDKDTFPQAVLGNVYQGWTGERWIDVRNVKGVYPIMLKRLDLCKQKGFDGVDPDNINSYQNDTGFPITAQNQIAYNKWIAQQAHNRGLSVGLKNDSEQIKALGSVFDFAVAESCYSDNFCNQYDDFLRKGKPVFMIEYTKNQNRINTICQYAKQKGYYFIFKNNNLDQYIQECN